MLKKILGLILPADPSVRRAELRRSILREEAKIGGRLFGPIPEGSRREFFCLDRHTWVWHEEWTDVNSIRHARTTRYDVRPHGIFKAQDGQPYQPITREEAARLYHAVDAYNQATDAHFAPLLAAA
jgi:hypothetical protein